MKKNLFTLFLVFVLCSMVLAQDDYRVLIYNGPGNGLDQSRAICMDANGNVYITGNSFGGSTTNNDFCTIKYNAYGVQQWIARFNGTGSYIDQANAIAVDGNGNVYVTGWAHMEPGGLDCGTPDYVTIKYNSSGVQQWMKKYDGTGNGVDNALAIVLDNQANVYITGSSVGANGVMEDFATIKYNTNGIQQWVARYNGPSNNIDVARAIGVDAAGNVFVTGSSVKLGQGADYVTIKYNSSGVQQWMVRYNGPGNGDDIPYALGVDLLGNVVVTGSAKGSTSNLDYTTIKYGSTGTVLWSKTYNGPGNGIDEARALVLDGPGNVYITGYSMGTTSNFDYATIMYNMDGVQQWINRYNGRANLIDKAWGIAISKRPCQGQNSEYSDGDSPCWTYSIYVTGQSQGTGTMYDYLTVKYNAYGDTLWTRRYNSTSNADDIPSGIAAIDNSEFVYVTGTTNNDYGTLWYYPITPGLQYNNVVHQLEQNYPNPFNPSTRIAFSVPKESHVQLTVYDIIGREVAILVDDKLAEGRFEVNWNAVNYPSGAYFYTLESDGVKVDTKRMLLIK